MSDLSLAINIMAIDSASAVLRGIAGIAQDVMKGDFSGAAMAAGAAIVGIGAASTKMAGDFQEGLTSLVTGAGEAKGNIGLVRDGILQMAVDTGTSTKQLTDGMYMIESAGYHGADGLKVLKAAAEGARVGNADLGQTANAVTTILTDYHLSGDQATAATNALITTVASGKTHLQDLASSMGSVLPLASSLGISFPQVAGGIAVMTNAGMDAQRASQNLANAIRSLAAPNGAAQKSMEAVGLSAQDLKDTLSTQGLAGAIQLVEDHVGNTFPAGSVDAVEAFKAIMGGATGYNVALMLGGKNMDAYKSNVDAISKSMNSGSKEVQGWSEIQGDFNFKLSQAQQAVNVLMINLGTALLPALSNILTAVTPLISAFADWITNNHVLADATNAVKIAINDAKIAIDAGKTAIHNIEEAVKSVINWYNQWKPQIDAVAGAITVFFTPALVKAGIEAAISGAQITKNFVQGLITTGTQSVITGAQLTVQFVQNMIKAGTEAVINGALVVKNFVGSLITAGMEGWQAAGKIAVFIGQMIATGANAVATGAVMAAKFVWSLIQAGAEAAKTAAIFVVNLVPSLISMAADGIMAAVSAIPGLVMGFGAWTVSALGAAAATIAATWPILLIIAGIALLVVGILLLVTHWSQVTAFLRGIWQGFMDWLHGALMFIVNIFVTAWHDVIAFLQAAWDFIVNAAKIAALVLFVVVTGPIGLLVLYIISHWQQVVDFLTAIWKTIQNVFSNVGSVFSNIGTGMWNGIKQGIDWIINGINQFIGYMNNLKIGLPAINIAGVSLPAQTIGLPQIPKIPLLAAGGDIMLGGSVIVGDAGPEILNLPAGASVSPLSSSSRNAQTVINITVNAPARTRNEAQEIAKTVMDELSRQLRQSGNLVTWTSGGRAS